MTEKAQTRSKSTFQTDEAAGSNEKLLLFDLGNILFELEGVEAFWPEFSNQPEKCQAWWSSSKYVHELETGKISDFADFYQLVCEELAINLKFDEFKEVFMGIIGKPFAGTREMLSQLATRYRVMILSNTNEPHWQYCNSLLPLAEYIERSFLSHEIGSMKPDSKIYKAVLADLNSDPQNIYYFDDKQENILAARKYGFKAYRSWGGDDLRERLMSLGFLHKS